MITTYISIADILLLAVFVGLLLYQISMQRKIKRDFDGIAEKYSYLITVKEGIVNNILGWLHTYGKSYRNLETAIHYYDQTLEREPRNKTALIHCARISEMMGDMDLAKRYYGNILINYPDHEEAQKKIAHLNS
ncbi:MAG: hypothetical protein ISS66_10335 [Desulfobacteraceae bacterium]|nr:hypothetical protein [Desulfobacteraceae bacterium]